MKYTILALLCSASIPLCYAAENPNPTGFTRMVRPRLNPPEPNVEPQAEVQECNTFLTEWIETSGILDKCQNGPEVSDISQTFKSHFENHSKEELSFLTEWMKSTGVWDKCENVSNVSDVFTNLTGYDRIQLRGVTFWLQASKLWNQCEVVRDILLHVVMFKSYPLKRLFTTTFIAIGSGIWNKCEDIEEITNLFIYLRDYPLEKLPFASKWISTSGALDKCEDASDISNLLLSIQDYPLENLSLSTEWMKSSGVWDKCHNGYIIGLILKGLKTFNIEELYNLTEKLPIQNDFLPIYIIGATLENISHKCKEAISVFIEDPETRSDTLEMIADILGEESPIAQDFFLLASGYDNSDDPDGFLSVYREMMEKREGPIQHPLRTQTPGIVLNLARVQEPRAAAPIHMPLNVWTRLFESFKNVDKESLSGIFEDVDYDSLLKLETNTNITSLLDPKDSLLINDRVSSYSFMLRDVLKRIQTLRQIDPMAAIESFSQLLVNMTTCQTGKLNGITHTYLLMNKDTVLDESDLGSEAFVQGIIHHFNEELRRFREGTLSAMVKSVVKGLNADPHDIYYIRGIIGGDIGLLFPGEVPRVDMNGNEVSSALREMSKQDLLNLFYQYYTVEEVIGLFHTKLNNGSFKIEDLGSGKNLTLKVINEFLREDAFDVETERYNPDYIVLDPSGNPVGLTPTAAKNLLLQMGFLTAVSQ